MAVQKTNSRAVSFVYNGVTISITSMTPKHTRTCVSDTASDNYDVGTDIVHESQQPVAMRTELAVEGYFDKTSTNLRLIAPLFSSTAALPVVINIDQSTVYGHGYFDCTEFETDMKVAPTPEMMGIKMTLLSNRVFTPGA